MQRPSSSLWPIPVRVQSSRMMFLINRLKYISNESSNVRACDADIGASAVNSRCPEVSP
jgi:hypothetical protein